MNQWLRRFSSGLSRHQEPRPVRVSLPVDSAPGAPSTWWYHLGNAPAVLAGAPLLGGRTLSLATSLSSTLALPVGWSIVPRRERVRRSTPLWVYLAPHIALNASHAAHGRAFIDDGLSTPRAEGASFMVGFDAECTADEATARSTTTHPVVAANPVAYQVRTSHVISSGRYPGRRVHRQELPNTRSQARGRPFSAARGESTHRIVHRCRLRRLRAADAAWAVDSHEQ